MIKCVTPFILHALMMSSKFIQSICLFLPVVAPYSFPTSLILSNISLGFSNSLFPGSLNLVLSGSGGTVNLTDDSQDNLVNSFIGTTRVFQLISGSNGTKEFWNVILQEGEEFWSTIRFQRC